MFADSLRAALHPPTEVAKAAHLVRRRGVTWLRNAKIDEVSLVNRGANRRRFTIFKSADFEPADVFDRLERALTEWFSNAVG